ncbi:MAG: aspartate--tRNA ligase [Prolixibacteraceae bacterium]|nr:aspartate--tRNA ligase [Prolixibacteraceae bacterium]
MYRTHTCGELRLDKKGSTVTLAGWIQRKRELGGMTFIDLRDRYGITQLVFNEKTPESVSQNLKTLGREFVIQVIGTVDERSSKNKNIPTGEIEINVKKLKILNSSLTPPFTIEENSDGGDDLRMKYRYLDLRRTPVKNNLLLRSKMSHLIRNYLIEQNFAEIETPDLMKSTPEGARDFVVPSRLNPGQFYALPQSPQIFKQLLMIAGFDRYFQIARCFRDEDLRADRQPEFTQIDCEMSFVEQEDILELFEGLIKHLFKDIKNLSLNDFPRLPYYDAMDLYGSDKPDIRFGMKIHEMTKFLKGKNFKIFDESEYIGGICAEGCGNYSRKQLNQLTDYVKRPQIGAKGLVYLKYNADGTFKSSVDKFYTTEDLKKWAEIFGAKAGDLILVLCGKKSKTQIQLGTLRLEIASKMKLTDNNIYKPLWVIDFPQFEWDQENNRWHAMHHPFTAPKDEDLPLLDTDPGKVRANAYDLVINGVEVGGGSLRIFHQDLQAKMFKVLGFTKESAEEQFGFLMNAFKYGAPPHAGIAFGLDRLVSMFAGLDSIRDVIAFPKNNAGRDMMNDAPSSISDIQLEELNIKVNLPKD